MPEFPYKDQAIARLIMNCHPSSFVGGGDSPALTTIKDRAETFMKRHESDSLLLPLYKHIRDSIDATANRLDIDEANLRFEHS